MARHKTLDHNFFASWSSQMAYVLGFFAADGNMIRNARGAHFISFKITDLDLLQAIQNAMGSNHAIGASVQPLPTQKTQYSLQLGSKKLFADLTLLGMTARKSSSLRLPSVPHKYINHFIRGYFDGDGCVYFATLKFKDRKKHRSILQVVFTCGHRVFLQKLLALLRKNGIKGGAIRMKPRGFDLLLSQHDCLALYHLMYDTMTATDIYLSRKYKKFRLAIGTLYPSELGM